MKRLWILPVLFLLMHTYCCGVPAGPAVSAASAVLIDGDSGRVLYARGEHDRRPIASITKLMTALVAAESGVAPETYITVTEEHMAEGSSMYLRPGEQLSLKELLYGLLMVSGNDAALAIAEGCAGSTDSFVARMNCKARELGMADSHFANPSGLDQEGHYSSAYDMALLARAILDNALVSDIVATRSIKVGERYLVNHNKLLWRCDGCIGMKTGYTTKAGRTLVSCMRRDGRTMICVTLSDPDDWKDHEALMSYGFEHFRMLHLCEQGEVMRLCPVRGSLLPAVPVLAADAAACLVSGEEQTAVRLVLEQPMTAPLLQDEVVGFCEFLLDGTVVARTELTAGTHVPADVCRPGIIARILRTRAAGE